MQIKNGQVGLTETYFPFDAVLNTEYTLQSRYLAAFSHWAYRVWCRQLAGSRYVGYVCTRCDYMYNVSRIKTAKL